MPWLTLCCSATLDIARKGKVWQVQPTNCKTVIEGHSGGLQNAVTRYAIAPKVLRALGELSSIKGGDEARKARGANSPYSSAEGVWLQRVMPILIRRAAEVAFDPLARFCRQFGRTPAHQGFNQSRRHCSSLIYTGYDRTDHSQCR